MRIIEQNTNGISKKIKRIPKADILVLVETHKTNPRKQLLLNSLGYQNVYISEGESKRKGVIILTDITPATTPIIDTEGNYIVMEIQYGKDIIQIVGIYLEPGNPPCPNIHNKLNELQNHLNQEHEIIITGDFNMYASDMDVHKTTVGTKRNIKKYNCCLKPFMEKLELFDIWREKNPTGRTFSYNASNNASRLDNTLTTDRNESNIIINYEILGNFYHKGTKIELKNYTKWGKGLWKLNLELLKNKDTINQIKRVIENAKAHKYLHNTLEWWDRLKSTIKKTLIKIGIANKKKENEEISNLDKQIAD